MKKVLITLPYKVDTGAKVQQIDFVYQTYIMQLVKRGVLPLLISALATEDMLLELYNQADGVLLVGGSDISPDLYGQKQDGLTKVTNPLRDSMEANVIQMAMRDKKPILGICRGAQIVNVVLGGTLIQDLYSSGVAEQHNVPDGSSYDDVATGHGNKIIVQHGSRLSKIVGGGEYLVNCAHHQGINHVSEYLKINSQSPSGVIEGLESIDSSHFVLLLLNHIETQNINFSNKIWVSFLSSLKV